MNSPEEQKAAYVREHFANTPPAKTTSGISIDPVYVPAADAAAQHAALGVPGSFPFTRGPYPTMYRGKPWTMRQYAGFGDAGETNARFRKLLERGQTGLSVAFDLPTQIGYDPDHEFAEGEVGKVGVSIATLDDLDRLFDGIPLDRVSVSMTINATATILLAFTIALAKRRGVAKDQLRGTVQNDILKEYIARGTYRFPIRPAMRLVTDLIGYCATDLPRWNPISISGYHMREAGCTAAQEIAFTLANGCAYVQDVLDRGLDVDAFAPQLSFFFNAHNHFFEEIGKFRAARRLWASLMRDRFGAKKAESMRLRFHTQTAGSTLTAQQPDNNVVRVSLQALAAVLGGTQSLHTNSKDEALGLPTEHAATLALRTQQIIAFESGVTDTVDPLGGAPFVEAMTDALEDAARTYLKRIDALGGAVPAIEQGFIQGEIHKAAYQHQLAVEKGDTIVVGVNKFTTDEPQADIFRVKDTLRGTRIREVEDARKRRDASAAKRTLEDVVRVAQSKQNLLPALVAAVEAGVTLGELCTALEGLFGRYRAPVL
ncbi:MAG: methylmalonyl-CoA mutase [Planctomycetes bacterium]|nr:methylmalonyl-CoA mutase [Planctomycetota bacterium]